MTKATTTTKPRKVRVVMSQKAVYEAGVMLNEHLELVPDTTLFRYRNHHNDATIAEAIKNMTGENIGKDHIAYLRIGLKGELSPHKLNGSVSLKQQVKALEERLTNLEKQWAEFSGAGTAVAA